MLSLVYVSSARHLYSEDELKALLQRSRDNNVRLGLTGMLLYKNGNFMQVLEGPEDTLAQLYSKIQSDPRHHTILQLMRKPIQEREFPSWSMGFKNLDDPGLRETPGYSPFLNEPLNAISFQADPTRTQKLLKMFREKM